MDPYDAAAVNGLDLGRRKIDDALLAQISVELSKTAAQFDRSGAFPHENIALLRRHGIIGLQSARDLAGDPRIVLRRVSLDVKPGEFIAVVGHSGCGKSTLLRLLAGLDQPDQGEVSLDGAPAPVTGRRFFPAARSCA